MEEDMSQIKHSFGDGPMVLPSDLLLSGTRTKPRDSGITVEEPSVFRAKCPILGLSLEAFFLWAPPRR